MADLRIHDLTDTQNSYSSGIYLATDDSTFTNTKKVAMGTIYPLISNLADGVGFNSNTSLLRIDVSGSGDEKYISLSDFFTNSGVINIIKVLGSTGWKVYGTGGDDVIVNSSKVVLGTFVCNAISVLGIVTLTGVIDTTSQMTTNETIFTLPSSIPTSSVNIYFNASDSQTSGSDENYEFWIPAGTRTIKNHSPSSSAGSQSVFCVTYPAI